MSETRWQLTATALSAVIALHDDDEELYRWLVESTEDLPGLCRHLAAVSCAIVDRGEHLDYTRNMRDMAGERFLYEVPAS